MPGFTGRGAPAAPVRRPRRLVRLRPWPRGALTRPRRPGRASGACRSAASTTASAIDAVLDAGLVAHLGFVHDGQPFVIPTLHARLGDRVYVHGSAASRTLRGLAAGIPACLTVTLLDGIVLARSVFEHSMNYRSVVVLGTATPVDEPEEKLDGARGVHREAPPGALGGGAAADAEGAEGHLGALACRSTRRRRRSATGGPEDGDTPGRRPRRLGRVPPARRPGARARPRPYAPPRDSRAARPPAVPAAGARLLGPPYTGRDDAPAVDTVVMKFGGSSVADPDKVGTSRAASSTPSGAGCASSARSPRWGRRPTP